MSAQFAPDQLAFKDGYGDQIKVFTRQAEQEIERNATSSSGAGDEEIDYEFRERDFHAVLSGYSSAKAKAMTTKNLRDEEEKRIMASYGPIPIRLEFPDGYIVQAYFPVDTTLRQLHSLVITLLLPQHQASFTLFTTPPKTLIKPKDLDTTTLYAAKFIPAARIHIGLESTSTGRSVLQPEVVKLSSTSPPPSKAEALQHPSKANQQQQQQPIDDAQQQQQQSKKKPNASGGGGGVPKWMKLSR